MPQQRTFDQLLPVEREFLTRERAYHIERIQDIEKRLNIPSSLASRDMRRVMQRAAREHPDGESDSR